MTEPTCLLTEAQQNEIIHALMDKCDQNQAISMLQSLPMVSGEPVAHVMGVWADSDEISVPLPAGTRLYASPQALTPITADDDLEKLKLDIANALASIAEYDQENTVLKAQLEAAKKDAERYLKLRRMAVELSLSHQVISQFVTNQGELDAAIQEGESMTPKSQTTADQVRELGLSVGDVIVGRENRGHEWSDTELTLLFIGKEVAVFSERNRSSVEGVISKWSKPKESASWNLQFRDWVKV